MVIDRYNSGHVMASMRMFDDDRAFFNQVVGAIETGNIPPCCTQVAVSLIDNLLVLSARLKGDRVRGCACVVALVWVCWCECAGRGSDTHLDCTALPIPVSHLLCLVPLASRPLCHLAGN